MTTTMRYLAFVLSVSINASCDDTLILNDKIIPEVPVQVQPGIRTSYPFNVMAQGILNYSFIDSHPEDICIVSWFDPPETLKEKPVPRQSNTYSFRLTPKVSGSLSVDVGRWVVEFDCKKSSMVPVDVKLIIDATLEHCVNGSTPVPCPTQ